MNSTIKKIYLGISILIILIFSYKSIGTFMFKHLPFIISSLLAFNIHKKMTFYKNTLAEEKIKKNNINEFIQESTMLYLKINETGIIKESNWKTCKILGYSKRELSVNQPKIFYKNDRKKIYETFYHKKQKFSKEITTKMICKNENIIPIQWSGYFDPKNKNIILSGIPLINSDTKLNSINIPGKNYLYNRLNKMITEKKSFSLALIDIDDFNTLKNNIDYKTQKRFINKFVNTLKNKLPKETFITKLPSNEFVIIFKKKYVKNKFQKYIKKLQKSFDKTWTIGTYKIHTTVSMSLVNFPENGKNYSTLLRNANLAMNSVKYNGKNNYLFYKNSFAKKTANENILSKKLQVAIIRNNLKLHYQPQLNLKTNKITGLEALLRWEVSKNKYISPGIFIPIAEKTGQIYDIEKLVFKKIFAFKDSLKNDSLRISINLSSKTLMNKEKFNELLNIIYKHKLPINNIIIEITETSIISDIQLAIIQLNKLKNIGFEIALDDFGTGFSSLSHLKNLPLDHVKLDREFIKEIHKNPKKLIIIKNLINLSRDLNYSVTAEGIEIPEELNCIKKLGCNTAQGFLISKPSSPEKIKTIIRNQNNYFSV